ncbi:MAG: hypothetical protein AM325_012000 [Candidatus Thorarchaeota archaeon SMTZ1-45]|nr:MAG: hypothetical protein AM325_13685 [Candidatus Thorarchaeota archaeon SMTZ1-45]
MTEVISRRRYITAFLIKILIVLSFPLTGFLSLSSVDWYSILFVVSGNQFIMFNSVFSVFVALFIMLPGILFEYHLNKKPISKSIRGRAVASSIICIFIGIYVPLGTASFPDMALFYARNYAPILTIAFFVILPVISRESMLRSVPFESRLRSYNSFRQIFRRKMKREILLSGLLWAGLVFCPFLISSVYTGWHPQFSYWSLFYEYEIYAEYSYFGGLQVIFSDTLRINALMPSEMLLFVFLSAIRFIFVRDIFRHQVTIVKKSRLISVAILGEILPAATVTLLTLSVIPLEFITLLFFPMPILPIVGFIYIKFSRAIPIKEEIWQDQEFRMWFEKEQESRLPETTDESIKVPMLYLIVSQVRKRMKE